MFQLHAAHLIKTISTFILNYIVMGDSVTR